MGLFDRSKTLIVAELSANHLGDIQVARDTIAAAANSGADAIKLQTYTADTITLNSSKVDFIVKGGTAWDGRTLYDLYQEAHTPWEWHATLFEDAHKLGMACFSSPFDESAVDFLRTFDPPAYKISSFEITDVNLIAKAAALQKTMIISTGAASEEDILLAIETCYKQGNRDVILLQCTSSYPAPIEGANMLKMADMVKKFGVRVGLSDHTMGSVVPTTATALGACIIEKHFILDRSLGGPDAAFSMEPLEFQEMVERVRETEKALGEVDYEITEDKKKSRRFLRSLYIADAIQEGEQFTAENLRSVRPGFGLHPKHLHEIIGKRANRNLEKGTPMKLEFVLDEKA